MRALITSPLLCLLIALLAACEPAPLLSREELLDPRACQSCHADHYREWSGSMHAYASEDPVFLAMNRRGQRETGGALGSFCVNCHAPLALREGATSDGLNLASVAPRLRGVTCFFCHTVEGVDGAHNNPLRLASDTVMRGAYRDPVANSAHPAAYSALHDRDQAASARLCGACHDVVTPAGGAIERTFAEWQASVFSRAGGATCGQCHMDQSSRLVPIAQAPGVGVRRAHSHAAPAVDTALVAGFPEQAAQRRAVQALLDTTLQSALCVQPGGATSGLRVILDNVAAGHSFPSGSAQDRRLWTEVIAYRGGAVIYRSGVVAAGAAVSAGADADLWLLRDCMLDGAGRPVSMFWQAQDHESNLLPTLETLDVVDPRYYRTHVVQSFPRGAGVIDGVPDRVTLRVRLEPIGLDVLDELIASGDLDPSVRAAMPVFDLGAEPLLEWTAEAAKDVYRDEGGRAVYCVSKTNLSGQAAKVPAVVRSRCGP